MELTIERLRKACEGDAAVRYNVRLQPAGGSGDKVFPPTYEGGQYAKEQRFVDGARLDCVILDSVQSQANRMESALLHAQRAGRISLPVVEVDFVGAGLEEVGNLTSLDAPHRLADAILRDSYLGKERFRESAVGKVLNTATLSNATELFAVCPTSLIFGMWDSSGPRGGLGTKFARAIVGEIVAVDAVFGVRPSSRLDPLGIQLNSGPIYKAKDPLDTWTIDPAKAEGGAAKPVKVGKEGKPSEINHGNVTPSLKNEKGEYHHGGVTFSYAKQTVVLSLAGLRKLSFPVGGERRDETDAAARTALAALGLVAIALAVETGGDLRSRCALVPEATQGGAVEFVCADGTVEQCVVTSKQAIQILAAAIVAARAAGLQWNDEVVKLTPRPDLVALVRKSRDLAMTAPATEA